MDNESTNTGSDPAPATPYPPSAGAEPPLKFTVATVTYNAATQLARTIESVEQQTYAHVEHLIVDGNSQDGTMELVHHYQGRHSNAAVRHEVACLSEPDRGLYDAMNKAIEMATGDYILFLNAGDRFHADDTLARIAAQVGTSSPLPAVIYGDTDIVDAQGRFLRHRRLSPPRDGLTWRSFRRGMLVCHQAFFARTDLARLYPSDLNYRYSADFDWCIRLMVDAARRKLPLQRVPLVVTDYLSEGLTTAHHRASLLERFHIMRRHYGLGLTLLEHVWFLVRALVK